VVGWIYLPGRRPFVVILDGAFQVAVKIEAPDIVAPVFQDIPGAVAGDRIARLCGRIFHDLEIAAVDLVHQVPVDLS